MSNWVRPSGACVLNAVPGRAGKLKATLAAGLVALGALSAEGLPAFAADPSRAPALEKVSLTLEPVTEVSVISIGASLLLGEITLNAAAMSGNATSGSSRSSGKAARAAEKRMLAAAAIEDAAQFYATGILGGILPTAVARLRELSSEAGLLTDEELVDVLVGVSEEIQQAGAARGAGQAKP